QERLGRVSARRQPRGDEAIVLEVRRRGAGRGRRPLGAAGARGARRRTPRHVRQRAPEDRPVIERINPSGLSTPTGYSHVVSTRGGKTIYIAGQVAFDATGTLVGKGDLDRN